MIANEATTRAQIQSAARSIRSQRPAYADIIDYYEQVFIAQEEVKPHVQIQLPPMDPETLAIQLKDDFPLVSTADFLIDQQAGVDLLSQLCEKTIHAKTDMATTARGVLAALQAERCEASNLFVALLEGDDDVFAQAADNLAVDKEALAFLIYSAAQPSLSACAARLERHLADVVWKKGYCPVCGSQPGLALLGIDGKRWLCCGFCWHKWATRRIFCPFCENTGKETLYYFFSEAEKGYRVDVCDRCSRYIKTIDTRAVEHPIYPPLEQVSTLHLDIKAREKGLESGS